MTDRGRAALRQEADAITIGPSSMRWLGGQLVIDFDEWSSPPLVSRLQGRITVTPAAVTSVELLLAPDGSHVWRPFAPASSVRVEISREGWNWEGHGYFDANFGTRALEQDFAHWTWGRFPTGDGCTCFYDSTRLDSGRLEAGIGFARDGSARIVDLPPAARLPRSGWGLKRQTYADRGARPRQVLSMLDAPFYCRSAVSTVLGGKDVVGVHETLDLRRFRSPFLKPILALRVPRRNRWRFSDKQATYSSAG